MVDMYVDTYMIENIDGGSDEADTLYLYAYYVWWNMYYTRELTKIFAYVVKLIVFDTVRGKGAT